MQEFLSKFPAPAKDAAATNLAQGIAPPKPYLSLPGKLPALKQREGEGQVSAYHKAPHPCFSRFRRPTLKALIS